MGGEKEKKCEGDNDWLGGNQVYSSSEKKKKKCQNSQYKSVFWFFFFFLFCFCFLVHSATLNTLNVRKRKRGGGGRKNRVYKLRLIYAILRFFFLSGSCGRGR